MASGIRLPDVLLRSRRLLSHTDLNFHTRCGETSPSHPSSTADTISVLSLQLETCLCDSVEAVSSWCESTRWCTLIGFFAFCRVARCQRYSAGSIILSHVLSRTQHMQLIEPSIDGLLKPSDYLSWWPMCAIKSLRRAAEKDPAGN